MSLNRLAPLFLALLPMTAAAHPHSWIEARLDLLVDGQGQLTGVRIAWTYDWDMSQYYLEDYDLDGDGDGVPDPDRLAGFAGKDVNWDAPGFEGDVFVSQDGNPTTLRPPQTFTASYEDEQITTSHIRPLATPLDASATPVTVQVYDPTFWTLYTLSRPLGLSDGAPCTVTVTPPDLAAAQAEMQKLIDEIPEGPLVEVQFPPVGRFYADVVTLDCR